jgi:Reverse transcriptase (RNA-dependent DNA polymerase)
VKLNVPEQYQQCYLQILLQNHEAVSQDKFDLGRTDTLMHEITLKTEEPIYVKQFKILDAHRKEVERHVLEWLKLGVIQPARYNSPIFAVMKKDGTVRLVQDFRALNNESYTDMYSMKDVSECIGEIGRSGSTIFTTIDLRAGFWQMILHPRARPYTAFTVPSMGQFQWVTSPMGLLGCPASFQRLMETVVNGISNVIVYINDLLVHLATHEEHLATLDKVLKHLVQHKIKLNLQTYKSAFLEAKKCLTSASASLKKASNQAQTN